MKQFIASHSKKILLFVGIVIALIVVFQVKTMAMGDAGIVDLDGLWQTGKEDLGQLKRLLL